MTASSSSNKPTQAPVVGNLSAGPRNSLTDVPGVRVGHVTLAQGNIQTGVTVIFPHTDDLFRNKVAAGASVINGFGKSVGLVQLQELGVIETPVALTNTFSVSAVAQAQIRQAIAANPAIGREWSTVNPLVLECNDGYLNDIQAMAVSEADYFHACDNAGLEFEQGAVGAGRGMSCFGLKGGIGSASRIARQEGALSGTAADYTVGALVLSNFGKLRHLRAGNVLTGEDIKRRMALREQALSSDHVIGEGEPDKGSIIMILATDAPLDARQLRRLSMRAAAGLARTGSSYGHGSGDIAIAFSTSMRVGQELQHAQQPVQSLHETQLDPLFDAAAEATEQAILHSLWAASAVTGRDGHTRLPITAWLED